MGPARQADDDRTIVAGQFDGDGPLIATPDYGERASIGPLPDTVEADGSAGRAGEVRRDRLA